MTLKLLLSSLLIVIAIITINRNLQVNSASEQAAARINKEMPTVFIEAVGLVKGSEPQDKGEQLIRLSLHNNTQWTLLYYTVLEPIDQGDWPVLYRVEDEKQCLVFNSRTVGSTPVFRLQSGKSIHFRIPRKHLSEGNSLYVEFQYDWEIRNGIDPYAREPKHRAYFSSFWLPESLKK